MIQVKKKNELNINKRILIYLVILGVIVLSVSGIWLKVYYMEKQTISELSDVSKELRLVYDNIIHDSGGNIKSTYFRNDCSVSNKSWLEQQISCGPSGNIILNDSVNIATAGDILTSALKGIDIGIEIADIKIGQESVDLSSKPNDRGIKCSLYYSQDLSSGVWSYGLVCRKDVSRVLPNYAVRE